MSWHISFHTNKFVTGETVYSFAVVIYAGLLSCLCGPIAHPQTVEDEL